MVLVSLVTFSERFKLNFFPPNNLAGLLVPIFSVIDNTAYAKYFWENKVHYKHCQVALPSFFYNCVSKLLFYMINSQLEVRREGRERKVVILSQMPDQTRKNLMPLDNAQ